MFYKDLVDSTQSNGIVQNENLANSFEILETTSIESIALEESTLELQRETALQGDGDQDADKDLCLIREKDKVQMLDNEEKEWDQSKEPGAVFNKKELEKIFEQFNEIDTELCGAINQSQLGMSMIAAGPFGFSHW